MKRQEVVEALRGHVPLTLPRAGAQAAVLVPLLPQRVSGDLSIVFTRRSEELGSHAGQVAFPGGHIEVGDVSAEAAALRETEEELGIAAGDIEVVGRLDEVYTVTGYHVCPVVGVLTADIKLTPDPREVARVFNVPLDLLLERERWREQQHTWRGSSFRIWHFPFDGEDIWGATAAMLRGFVELLWAYGQ